uniref:Uncharacterized protein n=1 Tax=candidate division WOR-3 bacterium TaxID=2052148 RepID=A0A7V3ZVU6_UNCW3
MMERIKEKVNKRIKNYTENLDLKLSQKKKEEMVNNFKNYLLEILSLEEKVKELLDKYGVLNERFFYYAYLREIYSLLNKYQKKTLEKEIALRIKKWQARGLKKFLLLKIKKIVKEKDFPTPTIYRTVPY